MPTGTVVKYSLPLDARQDQPYGAYVRGCDEGCPHWYRCMHQITKRFDAEDARVGCEVPVRDIDAWATAIDGETYSGKRLRTTSSDRDADTA